ncbi:glutamate carboxypeptidase [Colletotrichum sojae]|uniref:Glutamate carboxypeptidase n=1 Tax=Colletotrichum sojae TaxID=2175907 RepID=A0A8H6MLS4_9PEZI|nr:glutamate carboxypeptidase [Colletotrichum sojae]
MPLTLLSISALAATTYACTRDRDALHRGIANHSHHDLGHKKRDTGLDPSNRGRATTPTATTSAEWVETHLPWLVTNAVAYLNMISQSRIPPLGIGSDYAAFYYNGVSAIDIRSDGGKTDPVYRYHGHYDSYAWMAKFGDPGFKIHHAMGQWLSLVAYHIADDVVIPWDLPSAGRVLRTHYEDLKETVTAAYPDLELDLSPIDDAIAEFEGAAKRIAAAAKQALAFNNTVLFDVINGMYRDFFRGFASAGGLPGRPTFHNAISAPGLDNGYGAVVFPAVQDSLSSGDEEQARGWVEKSASAVSRAAEILRI